MEGVKPLNLQSIHQITVPTPYAVGDVHTYIHIGDTVTFFDAGVNTDEAWERFVYELKQLHLKPQDIGQILLTHHHPVHLGFVGRFAQQPHVYGHPLTDRWLQQSDEFFTHYVHFFNDLYKRWGVPKKFQTIEKTLAVTKKFSSKARLSHYLHDGDYIEAIPGLRVIETPGHAESHLSFYDEKEHLLIAGDLLLKHISSNPLLEPPVNPSMERPKPLLNYRKSMLRLLDYEIKQVLPGHGEIFSGHKELIRKRLEKQESRANHVLKYVTENQAQTPFEICKWLFSKQYEAQFGLTMSETIGQLDYLYSKGAIQTKQEQGIVYVS